MLYKVISVLLLILGLYLIYGNNFLKSNLLSYLITIVVFTLLVFNGLHFLALSYLTLDLILKIEIFSYLNNKGLVYKLPGFKKNEYLTKILSIFVLCLISSFFILNSRPTIKVSMMNEFQGSEIIGIVIVVLFLITGYAKKIEKWKL
jgi:hypothetical protein